MKMQSIKEQGIHLLTDFRSMFRFRQGPTRRLISLPSFGIAGRDDATEALSPRRDANAAVSRFYSARSLARSSPSSGLRERDCERERARESG